MATGMDSRFAAIHEEFLSCKICFEELHEPKSLPCLHTFCLHCLEQHARRNRRPNNRIACPLCRKELQIPHTGIQDLPTNFMVQGLKDHVVQSPPKGQAKLKQKKLMCEFHPSVASKWFCVYCHACLCQNCKQSGHNQLPCNCISMNNESQFVDTLFELQQRVACVLENDMEKWHVECREINSQMREVCEAKEKFREQTDDLFADIEEKLKERKRQINVSIDNIFDQGLAPELRLVEIEQFEEELIDTSVQLYTLQEKPDGVEAAIKHWSSFEPKLKLHSEMLKDSFEEISKGKMARPPKVRLEIFEDTVETIKNKYLVKFHIQRGPNVSEIRCRPLQEFDANMMCQNKACFGDIVSIRNTFYFTDLQNDCVRMMEQRGNDYVLDTFKDKYVNQHPWSLCYLSNDTFAVSYFTSPVIKIFSSKGVFLGKVFIGESCATLLPLSDGTIAVGLENHLVEFYNQDFEMRSDIPRQDLGRHPRIMCADKENNIFFSDGIHVYFWDRKRNGIKSISNHLIKFHPCGLCMDRWGNLLVASQNFSKIHIFSQEVDGSWKENVLLDQRQGKLHQPNTLAFNARNELVVGQSNGKIKTFAYTSQ